MCFLFICLLFLRGQSGEITAVNIGQKCPDTMLKSIINYSGRDIKLSDFRGKLIILDFFGTFCVPCVKGLSHMNSLQSKYIDKIKILIVCQEQKEEIEHFYERYKKKQNLQLPFVTSDTTFCQYFRHSIVPFFIVIDENGFVKGFPSPEEMNEQHIDDLLSHREVKFTGDNGIKMNQVNTNGPILIDTVANNEGALLYHSIVTSYLGNRQGSSYQREYQDSSISARITVSNNTIAFLYQMAFGHFHKNGRPSFVSWNRVIIEARDSFRIRRPVGLDESNWVIKNNYCYDLILPGGFKGDAHEVMIADLNRTFGYDVRMEKRKTKCLVLKRGQNADRLLTKGGVKIEEINTEYIKMQNASWKEMLYWLENKYLYKLPIIDETGFDLVDLDLNADLTDFSSLSKALKLMGINFVEEEKEIDMLVIGDKIDKKYSEN
jgi:thiol-disulfide isomerase/thioredoxin